MRRQPLLRVGAVTPDAYRTLTKPYGEQGLAYLTAKYGARLVSVFDREGNPIALPVPA